MISSPAFFINLLSIIMTLSVTIPLWRIRTKNGAKQLFLVSILMLVWSITSFAGLVSPDISTKMFWRNLNQIGVFYTPVATLLFSIAYTGIGNARRKLIAHASFALQSIVILLIWTDGYHHLIRASISVQETANSLILVVEPSMLAKFFISFNFVFTFFAFGLFSLYSFKTTANFRKHNIAVFIGMLIATIYSLFRVMMASSVTQVTPIPGVFAVSALFMLLGVYRYDLLKIAPLAHEQVFHFLGDGLIIASPQGKVLEANQAALSMMGPTHAELCNNLIVEAPQWYEMMSQGMEGESSFYRAEKFFTSNVYTIKSKHGIILGTISLLKDNTEQKQKNDLLKTRAELDGLTGIYNRHTFIGEVEKRLVSTKRGNSLVFFDLDNFKMVNDRYGHMAGDRVLQAIVACASTILKGIDVMGRMGGEEFAIFHATENKEETLAWAENLRKKVEETVIQVEGNSISCTISIGLCFSKTASFDDLYRNADKELYKAKEAGKNCIRYTYIIDPQA